MNINEYLPFWNKLSSKEKQLIQKNCSEKKYLSKSLITENEKCDGFIIIKSGKLRVYTISDSGREITLFKLFNYDMCLFSSSCIFKDITFDIMLETEEDTTIFVIPAHIYENLMKTSLSVSNYTNELMSSRFSDIMWLLDQILNKNMISRISLFLHEEYIYHNMVDLSITHEEIAKHLGTAREVISRLLNYMQKDGIIKTKRGIISIVDKEKLKNLCDEK